MAPTAETLSFTFRAIDEPALGAKWRAAFMDFWPAYKQWFVLSGEDKRPSYLAGLHALREHMPEFVGCYEAMVELAGGGDYASRFLAQYCPPPFFQACSQAIWLNGEPALLRNYDFSPALCDGLVMRTAWHGNGVIAMTDCMSGVLDGMNEQGLAVSLAFGGRRVVGEGFGITLILRYVLEFCADVAQACEVLKRIPVHVAYNVALVDRNNGFATVRVAPGEDAVVTDQRLSTNHQGRKRWKRYAQLIQTDSRLKHLRGLLADGFENVDDFAAQFLRPPLFRDAYAEGFGTVFTSVYLPARNQVRYLWRDAAWVLDMANFTEQTCDVAFTDTQGIPQPSLEPLVPHPIHVTGRFLKP